MASIWFTQAGRKKSRNVSGQNEHCNPDSWAPVLSLWNVTEKKEGQRIECASCGNQYRLVAGVAVRDGRRVHR